MPKILPFKAWRYNSSLIKKINELTSPLFDVVSEKQRQKLYKNQYSSIHLSVPEGSKPEEKAKETLNHWKENKIIVQDKLPGIYVYYQYFTLPGSVKELCRKGFICNIHLHDWSEKQILRHENTIPHSVNDRIQILQNTELNISPTHGLYTDEQKILEKYMDESMKNPMYSTEDYQGVRDVLSVIHDYKVIKIFMNHLKNRQVILADGHHRYEGSLSVMKAKRSMNPNHTGEEGYNYHLMYLTNTESDHLRILPTHRLVKNLESFNEKDVLRKLKEYFTIKPVDDAFTLNEVILGKKWAFGLLFKDRAFKLRLKPKCIEQLKWPFPDIIKHLDLTVVHYFIFERVLGISGKKQKYSENIEFDRNFSDCYARIIKDEAQMAVIVNEVTMEEVKKVCFSGYTLPQKSTYFYPKVISGFLFSSLKDDEFALPNCLSF